MKGTGEAPTHVFSTAVEQKIAERTRTLVVGPYLAPASRARFGETNSRDNDARLDEARGLALAIDLNVVDAVIAPLRAPRPATYIGSGKVEELKGRVEAEEIGLVMMDCALSPIQQSNLEKALGAKVIDRTGLILEIFGRRARTREGALQVELAHLSYQKGRLVRSWTHLERQRGGFGFLGGPGETQIEADRRLLQDRMRRIEKELESVTRTRGLHRASRDKVPFPTVALVGYTNAGKSTLFNRLTRAEVLAKDMLFATLDPTTRLVTMPHGDKVILSDTVGFISDLPTLLVAAFRATLEDVVEADLILHVRDIAHEDAEAQSEDVARILAELGVGEDRRSRIIEVWNKADLLPEQERERLFNVTRIGQPGERPMLVSAITGEGIDALRLEIEARLTQGHARYSVVVPAEDGAAAAWLHDNATVLERRMTDEDQVAFEIKVAPERVARLERRFGAAARRHPAGAD